MGRRLARADLGVNTVDSSCPLTQRAARLLAHGRRSSTKHSYCGKWFRFVEFCTVTLRQLYLQRPRRPLPASPRTVLLYIAHLSEEGLVSESSLNPYTAAINQAHEDRGWARPALGHYFRLSRAGWRALKGAAHDAQGLHSTLPAEVMFDILQLDLTTSDTHTLRRCACLVLCYCWYNRADSGASPSPSRHLRRSRYHGQCSRQDPSPERCLPYSSPAPRSS